jgi:hypothetical protein
LMSTIAGSTFEATAATSSPPVVPLPVSEPDEKGKRWPVRRARTSRP